MQTVYVFTVNGGDGSYSVGYTTDPTLLDRLEEEDPETYYNEGYADTLYFPDTLDLAACGIHLYTEEETLGEPLA